MVYAPVTAYRTQQVSSANPEQQAALLMEAGQVFLFKAKSAIQKKDFNVMATSLGRVAEIINEAEFRLSSDETNELVINLSALYSWWIAKLLQIAKTKNISDIDALITQFGEIKSSWEQVK